AVSGSTRDRASGEGGAGAVTSPFGVRARICQEYARPRARAVGAVHVSPDCDSLSATLSRLASKTATTYPVAPGAAVHENSGRLLSTAVAIGSIGRYSSAADGPSSVP